MTRFVIRDLVTGNIGSVEAMYPSPQPPVHPDAAAETRPREAELAQAPATKYENPLQGPIGSFGSIIPAPSAFCGDVYQLPDTIHQLPDFRELDPIGSLYTSALDVPYQIYSPSSEVPGEPPGEPFGIDYHATLWITVPGHYNFLLLSDDGAFLRIDDERLIDVDGIHAAETASREIHLDPGRHSVEVQYFEDAVGALGLQLWVKPPSDNWQLFDLRNFTQAAPRSKESSAAPGP